MGRMTCKNIPNLHTMWHDRFIQEQVENCLKDCLALIEMMWIQKLSPRGRGASVVVYVNQRVKWPHKFVLAGTSKDRLNYDKLNISQWMAGFCQIL